MLSSFICGSSQNEENEDSIIISSPCSTPKRSRRSGSSSYWRNKENKNRYSNVGLDKFNALLSEIEEKKQKIYTQKGAEDIALVQFVISSDNEIKPVIVVKKKAGKRPSDASSTMSSSWKTTKHNNSLQVSEHRKILTDQNHDNEASSGGNKIKLEVEEIIPNKKKKRGSHFKLEEFKQPFYYLPVAVILILLFLAIYGRPFAILCTCIGWYLIPILTRGGINSSSSSNDNNNNNNQRNLKRKKEHSRRSIDRTLLFVTSSNNNKDGSSSPTSVFNGPAAGISTPLKHGHRRSW